MSVGRRRLLRWIALGAALPAGIACNTRTLEAPTPVAAPTEMGVDLVSPNRTADILFMIDDSSSMEGAQTNLRANMASFMDVLKNISGGLPDLHIAVVTSDLGAGDGQSIAGCSVGGDGGVFRHAPTGSCAATGLDPGATYLIDTGGTNPVTNFGTEDITNAFQCIAGVGATGCGFEHQLASVARALGADGRPPPPENAGFLRPDAYLLIVLVTNEDDCSAPPGSPLFDPTSATLESTYGPTENFICNEWGHLCSRGGGPLARPSRLAPTGSAADIVTYSPAGGPDNCVSAEDQGLLTPVRTIADQIKALKADPAHQIMVAALAGPTTAYQVGWRPSPTGNGGPWPQIAHSCGDETAPTGFADPAVRVQAFVSEFGPNGLIASFCQDNYAQALGTFASAFTREISFPFCVVGAVATKPGSTTPDCAVVELQPNAGDPSHPLSAVIPACADAGGQVPCWTLGPPAAGAGCAAGAQTVTVDWGGASPPANAKTQASCAMCVPGAPDPARHCP
jgi:hypothetical protein